MRLLAVYICVITLWKQNVFKAPFLGQWINQSPFLNVFVIKRGFRSFTYLA